MAIPWHMGSFCACRNCSRSRKSGSRFTVQADKGGWPAVRFLPALIGHEIADARSRLERYLAQIRLPPGKTLISPICRSLPM